MAYTPEFMQPASAVQTGTAPAVVPVDEPEDYTPEFMTPKPTIGTTPKPTIQPDVADPRTTVADPITPSPAQPAQPQPTVEQPPARQEYKPDFMKPKAAPVAPVQETVDTTSPTVQPGVDVNLAEAEYTPEFMQKEPAPSVTPEAPPAQAGMVAPPVQVGPEATWGEVLKSVPGQALEGARAAVGGVRRLIGEEMHLELTEQQQLEMGIPINQVRGAQPLYKVLAPQLSKTPEAQAMADLLGVDPNEAVYMMNENPWEKGGSEQAAAAFEELQRITPRDMTFWQQATSTAAVSLGQMTPGAIISILTRSPHAMIASFGALEFGRSYAEAREKGLPKDRALRHATISGMLEAGTEYLPGKMLFKAGTAPFKRLVNFMAAELPGENIAEVGQRLSAWMNGLEGQPTAQEIIDTIKLTSAATVIGGGAQVGLAQVAHKVIGTKAEVEPVEQPPMAAEDIIGVEEEEAAPPPTPAAAAPEIVPAEEIAAREAEVEEISERERVEERRVAEAERRVAEEPFLEEKRVSEKERRAPVELEPKLAVAERAPEPTLVDVVDDFLSGDEEFVPQATEELRSRLVPALTDKSGKIIKGVLGESHADIMDKLPERTKAAQSGFFDSVTGEFFTKKELRYLGSEDLMTDEQQQEFLVRQGFTKFVAKESRLSPEEAEVERKERAEGEKPLKGLPSKLQEFGEVYHAPGPSKFIRDSAVEYMGDRKYTPPTDYAKVDPAAATAVAKAYEELPEFDDEASIKAQPNYKEVKSAYEAMAKETRAQFDHIIGETGLKVDFVKDTESDAYRDSPRRAIDDINENNHLWVYSTRDGFGEDKITKLPAWHPLLQETDITISGQKALVNDLFRIVHDYYGHAKEGVGFRASGEFNAWRQHSSMYSPEARRAMTTELRGQNSWVNYGPSGAVNRKADITKTVFPKDRMGLLPEWASDPTRAYDKAAKVEVTKAALATEEKAVDKERLRPKKIEAMARLRQVYRGTQIQFTQSKTMRGWLTREQEEQLDEVAAIFNKDIVYVRPATETARYVEGIALIPTTPGIVQTKTIYIKEGSSYSNLRLFGHELVHHLRNDHKDLYDQLAEIVELVNPGLSKHASGLGTGKTPALLKEELIADFIGDNFENENFWEDVVKDNPSLGQKLLDIVTKWIAKINRLITPNTLGGDEFIKNLNQMRQAGAKVIAEYADRQQKVVEGYDKYADVVVKQAVRPKTIMEFWAAKGGFNREEAEAQGIDPADFTKRYKGKYMFPKTGGMTFDEGAEAAREQGEDVYGPNDVLAIMYDHLRGVTMTQEDVDNQMDSMEESDRARAEDTSIHKIYKTGRWVGAPDFVKSGKQLAKMREVLRHLASEGEGRRFWYEESGKAMLDYFGGNVEEATKFAKVVAIYSPRQQVAGNTTQALKAWYQYKAGQPIKVGMGRTDNNASEQMYGNKDWTGLKTNAFYQNMMFGIDPAQAQEMVTIDMWMMGSMDFHTQAPSEQQYRFVEREVRRLAEEFGWEPHQVQASVWSAYRTRAVEAADDLRTFANRDKIEQGSNAWFHLQHKLAMEESVTPDQVQGGGYNFADALRERTVHLTADVAPGYRTGILPNFSHVNLNIQTEYMREVNAVEKGEIARMLDLPEGILAEGFYASNSDVGVAGNIFVPMATEPEVIEGKKSPGPRKVSDKMRAKLDEYIAMRGYVFSQEEVLWNYPRFTAPKSEHDGADISTRRSLDAYETRILYDALKSHFNSEWIAPGALENGARIINITLNPETGVPLFEQISVKDFQDGVKEVVGALPQEFAGGVETTRSFKHDGSYIDNNWEKNKNGEVFKKTIDKKHLPALYKMREKIKMVNEKYAAMPEMKRIDAIANMEAKHTVVNFPVSGKATDTPGSLNSVRVIYYGDRSTHAVTGSGIGNTRSEDRRTRGHPVLGNRINLYTKPQKGMTGQVPHKAVIHNIYDAAADPQGLRALVAKSPVEGENQLNAFELMILKAGFDGFKSEDRVVLLGQRVLEVQPADASSFAEPTYEVKYSVTPQEQKKMPDPLDVMDALREGRPIEAILRAMFKYTGIRWATRAGYNQLKKTLTERKFKNAPEGSYREWFNNGLERVRVGVVDRHGIPQAHLDASDKQKMNERQLAMKGTTILADLTKSGLVTDSSEAQVLQAVLTGEQIADEHWAKVAAPIRKAIDELGQSAVEFGLVSQESYDRNRLTYLHRVYKKHEDVGVLARGVRKIFSARRKSLLGTALKGRGMWVDISADKMLEDTETAYNVTVKKGDKLIMYSKFSNLERPKDVWKRPKVLKRVLVPAGRDVDMSSYENDPTWVNSGEWEIRDTSKQKGKEYTLWRDHTKEERTRMGEILDSRYTILKTFHSMAHDLSTGQMFAEIAGNSELTWQGKGEPDEGVSVEPSNHSWTTYVGVDWVRVPSVKIKGTGGKYKYGKLAGKYVNGGVWRDLADMDKMQSPGVWRTLMTQWKLNKTARNPVVHMNNIMANVALMDMADVRGRDLYRAFKAMLDRKNPEGSWAEAEIAGAFDNSFVLEEIKKNKLDPMLRELLNEATRDPQDGSVVGVAGTLTGVFRIMHKHMAKFDQWSVDKYQMEDMVFRMALFMRRRAQGIDPLIAAREARDQFINYDIKAPWINMLRRTIMPFLSYTYRAVPMVANTLANRPHKIAKYAAIMYMVNLMGYWMDDDGDDNLFEYWMSDRRKYVEDEERSVLRDMDNGVTWAGTPKLVRMGWRDSYGNPVFLDMKRWLPAADIFDTGQSWIPQPFQWSGPMQLGFEMVMNRSMYFDREIYDKDTADAGDIASALSIHLYKSWVPSAPWVPGSWYQEKIMKSVLGYRDPQGRRYPVSTAVLNSIGIKLKPLDVQWNKNYKIRRLEHTMNKLMSERFYLEADRRRAPESGIVENVTQFMYERDIKALDKKIDKVRKKAEEFINP